MKHFEKLPDLLIGVIPCIKYIFCKKIIIIGYKKNVDIMETLSRTPIFVVEGVQSIFFFLSRD